MWWPNPDSLLDLEVTDNDEGWLLSAPDGSELAAWIGYWNQSEEHHQFFEKEFLRSLLEHAKFTLEQHGQSQEQPDGQNSNRVETEEVGAGSVA